MLRKSLITAKSVRFTDKKECCRDKTRGRCVNYNNMIKSTAFIHSQTGKVFRPKVLLVFWLCYLFNEMSLLFDLQHVGRTTVQIRWTDMTAPVAKKTLIIQLLCSGLVYVLKWQIVCAGRYMRTKHYRGKMLCPCLMHFLKNLCNCTDFFKFWTLE